MLADVPDFGDLGLTRAQVAHKSIYNTTGAKKGAATHMCLYGL
jgi:hypothetical protein